LSTPAVYDESEQEEALMLCPGCGKELDAEAEFCDSCGAPTGRAGDPGPVEGGSATGPPETLPEPGPFPSGTPPPPLPSTFLEAPKRRVSLGVLIAVIAVTVLVISAAVSVTAVLVVSSSQKAAQRKTCQANQRNVQMAIMTYAATSPDETYPTSLEDLVSSGVLDRIPTCPSGTKPYIWVKGSVNTPPSISCPNRADHAL
jgi:competence protein ComGC